MSMGRVISIRISDTLYGHLERKANVHGSTVSEVSRDILIEHLRIENVLDALQEIKKNQSQVFAEIRNFAHGGSNTGTTDNKLLSEILERVTWLLEISPQGAKRLREEGER